MVRAEADTDAASARTSAANAGGAPAAGQETAATAGLAPILPGGMGESLEGVGDASTARDGQPPLEQRMNGETAAMPDVGLLELVNRANGHVDHRKNVPLGILAFKRIVGLLAHFLQADERVGEAADFHWKRPHGPLLLTRDPGLPVLDSPMHLMPFRAAAAAGKQVGGRWPDSGTARSTPC